MKQTEKRLEIGNTFCLVQMGLVALSVASIHFQEQMHFQEGALKLAVDLNAGDSW